MSLQQDDAQQTRTANHLTVGGQIDPNCADTYLLLASGEVFVVSTATLLQAAKRAPQGASETAYAHAEEQQLIPVIEESLVVGKRVVERETIRVHKVSEEHVEQQEVPLTEIAWQVERVPINELVPQRPEVRQEGDTVIYPVLEERLVVSRQLVLTEELRVTRQVRSSSQTVSEVVHRERVEVERIPSVPLPRD